MAQVANSQSALTAMQLFVNVTYLFCDQVSRKASTFFIYQL